MQKGPGGPCERDDEAFSDGRFYCRDVFKHQMAMDAERLCRRHRGVICDAILDSHSDHDQRFASLRFTASLEDCEATRARAKDVGTLSGRPGSNVWFPR